MSLAGRLEKVTLSYPISTVTAIGSFDDKQVLVANGNKHSGKECLVRFDLRQRRDYFIRNGEYVLNEANNHPPIGNFITSEIPLKFRGLNSDQYVFTALWEERMVKGKRLPTMNEINHYYDPGKAGGIPYFVKPHNGMLGALITPAGFHKIWHTWSYPQFMHERLADPERASRLVVAETPDVLEEITTALLENCLIPIRMEPLR